MDFANRVLDIIRHVPLGRVATYGQVAALAGYPRRARHVGHALRNCPGDVPWHRSWERGAAYASSHLNDNWNYCEPRES